MATMPGLRPLALGEILDAAFRVFGRRWRSFVAVGLIVGVPLSLASTGLVLAFAPEQFDLDTAENPLTPLTEPGAGGAVTAVLAARLLDLVASALAFAACLRIAAGDLLARDPGPGAAIGFGARRLGSFVGLLIVIGVGVGVGLVLLVVPGVWLGTIWALALPALVVERTGVFGSLARSRALVRGRFWPVLGVIALSFLIAIVGGGIGGAIAGAFARAAGAGAETSGAVGAFVSGVIGLAVVIPIAAALLLMLYVDQRVRGEGMTRAALAGALGEPEPQTEPYPEPARPAWQPEPPPERPAERDDGPELPGGWRPPRAGP